jgi:tetratricopeptide (TPR) repeat protein
MIRARAIAKVAVLLWLAAAAGCIPDDRHVDEEKDPHFLRGRNLVNGQDFKGAVEEFEKALESNPRSAAAHFELGWLYENKINDYAGAIYHYERYLQLQPQSARAQALDVRERVRGCKQQLANSEFPLPNSQNLQREVDRLMAENMVLRQQLEMARGQAAAKSTLAAAPVQSAPVQSAPVQAATPRAAVAVAAAPAQHRVHIVKERETISSIAAKYGLRPAAVLEANPHVDPRRLRVGQSLNLP